MDEVQLSIEDISPILGSQQLTIITLQKQVEALRARVAELEARKPLDEMADKDLRRDGVKA